MANRVLVLLLCGSLAAALPGADASTGFWALPDGSSARSVRVDSAGNVYVAGSTSPPTQNRSDAFIAKFSPAGEPLYLVTLGGNGDDVFQAVALDATGSAFVTGLSASRDFPVTAGAAQTAFQAPSYQGVIVKVDRRGKVAYATYFGNTSNTIGNDIVVTRSGEAVFTGQSVDEGFGSTSGAAASSPATNTFFVAKLNAAGTAISFVNRGIGGGKVALDAQGNIVAAGATYGNQDPPITPGAFQIAHGTQACAGTGWVGIACIYQHVAKLDPTGSRLLFSTLVTGTFGATPAGLAVDGAGDIYVAGTTRSPDYPVTAGSLQDTYLATNPVTPPYIGPHPPIIAPAPTGYVTKLKADGSGLVFSTFAGGSASDTITGMVLASEGLLLAGIASSPDFPGLFGVPPVCLPQLYVIRMTLDGTAVSRATLAEAPIEQLSRAGLAVTAALAADAAGILFVAAGPGVQRVDPELPLRPIACTANASDLVTTKTVAPGQLLALFGSRLAEYTATGAPSDGVFPSTLGNLQVRFDGVTAPLLYVSPKQVNVAVPYEVTSSTVRMELATEGNEIRDTRELQVVPRNPSVYLRPYTPAPCNGSFSTTEWTGRAPLALNEDGTTNSCEHPAPPGSVVSLFLNGAGQTSPPLATGAASAEATALALGVNVEMSDQTPLEVVGVHLVPGSISSVAQVQFRAPATGSFSAVPFAVSVEGVRAAGPPLLLWVRPAR